MTTIESAIISTEDCNFCAGYAFQICYGESSQSYTLYLIANLDKERSDWINVLRTGSYDFVFVHSVINFK